MTAIRKLICTTCSKSFKAKGDLNRHLLTHTGEKPFACKTCSKSFAQSTALRTHMNTHTGAKPFACGIDGCSKAFGDPSSRSRHRNEVHSSGSRFHCPDARCSSSMKRRHAFVHHLKKHGMYTDGMDLNHFFYESEDMASPDSKSLISFSPSVSPQPIQSSLGANEFDDSNVLYDLITSQHPLPQTATTTHISPIPPIVSHQYIQELYIDSDLPVRSQQLFLSPTIPDFPILSPSYEWSINGNDLNGVLFNTRFPPQLGCGVDWNPSVGSYQLEANFLLPQVFTN